MKLFREIKEGLLTFARALACLVEATDQNTAAVKENTAALAAQRESITNIEKAVGQIQLSAAYLSASERESRNRSGQRTELYQ